MDYITSSGSEQETTSEQGYKRAFIVGALAAAIALALSLPISGHFTLCNKIFNRMVDKHIEKSEDIELEDIDEASEQGIVAQAPLETQW